MYERHAGFDRTASRALALALVALLLAGAAHALTGDDARSIYRKAPYIVFNGSPDEMDVHWQLMETVRCTLSWGLAGGPPTHSVETLQHTWGHQHTFTIAELTGDALYTYEVRAAGELAGGSFRTPPVPDAAELKFLAYGDTRTYPEDYDTVSAAVLDLVASDPEYQTFAIHVGDLVENGGDETSWDLEFFDPLRLNIREFHAMVSTQALRGNHEGDGIMFYKYIPYPFVSDFYWSFDYGPAHVAIVDQYVDYGPGSPQLMWLENDLATTDRPWKFVALHEPGWSAGVHTNEPLVQTAIHPLCTEYGVAAVFAGHNHYYARAEVNGVQHVTTGGGGAPLYPPEEGQPYVVFADDVHHFCAIQLDADTLRYAAIDVDGATIDSFVMERPATSVAESETEGYLQLSLHRPVPNPTTDSAALAFTLREPGRVRVAVYNVAGRRVATLDAGDLPAGEHAVVWDGRDDAGRPVASGIYLCEASSLDTTARARVVVLR